MSAPTSALEIYNLALLQLSEDTIGSFTEGSVAAKVGSRIYHWRRQSLLRNFIWNFARHRGTCNLVADETPPFDYETYYDLPSDCLRVHAIGLEQDLWAPIPNDVQGRRLLLNPGDLGDDEPEETLEILYTKDETDVTKFDKLFIDCLVADLSAHACMPITGDMKLKVQLFQELRMKLAEAVAVNHQERPMRVIERDYIRQARASEVDTSSSQWSNLPVTWPD